MSGHGEAFWSAVCRGAADELREAVAAVEDEDERADALESCVYVPGGALEESCTLVAAAACLGGAECVDVLLAGGADATAVTSGEVQSPLHLMARAFAGADAARIVQALVDGGCAVDMADAAGLQALHLAAARGAIDMVDALVDAGGSLDARDSLQRTPLFHAASNGQHTTMEHLLTLGASHDVTDIEGMQPLHWATTPAAVDALLDLGVDLNAQDSSGATALHRAALRRTSGDCVAHLLSAGADPAVIDAEGATPLHWAAGAVHTDAVSLLLGHGSPVNSLDRLFRTPLDWIPAQTPTGVGADRRQAAMDALGEQGGTYMHQRATISAIIIQSLVRMRAQRRRFMALLAESGGEATAQAIDEIVDEAGVDPLADALGQARETAPGEEAAAVAIQAAFRGYMVRSRPRAAGNIATTDADAEAEAEQEQEQEQEEPAKPMSRDDRLKEAMAEIHNLRAQLGNNAKQQPVAAIPPQPKKRRSALSRGSHPRSAAAARVTFSEKIHVRRMSVDSHRSSEDGGSPVASGPSRAPAPAPGAGPSAPPPRPSSAGSRRTARRQPSQPPLAPQTQPGAQHPPARKPRPPSATRARPSSAPTRRRGPETAGAGEGAKSKDAGVEGGRRQPIRPGNYGPTRKAPKLDYSSQTGRAYAPFRFPRSASPSPRTLSVFRKSVPVRAVGNEKPSGARVRSAPRRRAAWDGHKAGAGQGAQHYHHHHYYVLHPSLDKYRQSPVLQHQRSPVQSPPGHLHHVHHILDPDSSIDRTGQDPDALQKLPAIAGTEDAGQVYEYLAEVLDAALEPRPQSQ